MNEKKPLLVIKGATSAGKSDVAVLVAQKTGGEIVSADSMQVYRGMDIGTGKVTEEEMGGVPHFLLDVADPREEFDIARYVRYAEEAVSGIHARGHLPIVCGGTGFYIQALVKGIDFAEGETSEAYREELARFAEEHGPEALHARLAAQDPEAAEAIHPNNVKRVIRALEYLHETGKPISQKNKEEKQQESPYDVLSFFLDLDREVLYQRIETRVDRMLDMGLLEEVRALKEAGLTPEDRSMQGLGYKEILRYLSGETSFEEAIRVLKRDTRHFAKRQLTWFRHEEGNIRLSLEAFDMDKEKIADEIVKEVRKRFGGTIYV